MGRKIILTDELRQAILEQIEDGRSVRSFCSLLDFGKTKYYKFIDEDETFAEQVQHAYDIGKKSRKSEAEECVLDCIRRGDGKLAMEYLQCTHPSEYAKRRIQDNTHDLASPFDKLFEALEKLDGKPDGTEKK